MIPLKEETLDPEKKMFIDEQKEVKILSISALHREFLFLENMGDF